MSDTDNWIKKGISALKSELFNSALASNGFFGLILTCFEKIVEIDFACPCNPKWNALFASTYFLSPGVVASVLMLVIKGCEGNRCQKWEHFLLFGLVPFMMWLILVFLDGQYYACAKTDWSGRFVAIDKAAPQRWCEPANSTLSMEKMSLTQDWYSVPQAYGIGILLSCLLFGLLKLCKKKLQKGTDRSTETLALRQRHTL